MTNIFTDEHRELIIDAIKNGSVDDLKSVILKYKNYDGFSLVFGYKVDYNPLMFCCFSVRLKMIEFLLNFDEVSNNINFQDNNGFTALIVAAVNSNNIISNKIINLLIKNGANLNIKNNNGHNALYWFLIKCPFNILSLNIIDKMLEFGSIVNFDIFECLDVYFNKKTKNEDTEIIKLLIMRGFDF